VSVPGNSVQGVKQVAKVGVLPSERDAAALYETLQTCNLAASWLSAQMHAARVFRKIDAQHRFYIATTTSGKKASGARLNSYRSRLARLRKRLQAKKTRSARRLLKKRRRIETGFAADINHQISKCIVAEAERTGYGIAVEQLTGIRDRVRPRKPQRATPHSWAFAQLGSFLAYKAKQAGVAFVEVAARGIERWGEVMRPYAAPTLAAS
jgi:IS605 OrfB family transposase